MPRKCRCCVRAELRTATTDTAQAILAKVLPRWERTLARDEVLLFGGGGRVMVPTISAPLTPLTLVTLLEHPVIRVADGIERLVKYRLQGYNDPRVRHSAGQAEPWPFRIGTMNSTGVG